MIIDSGRLRLSYRMFYCFTRLLLLCARTVSVFYGTGLTACMYGNGLTALSMQDTALRAEYAGIRGKIRNTR